MKQTHFTLIKCEIILLLFLLCYCEVVQGIYGDPF